MTYGRFSHLKFDEDGSQAMNGTLASVGYTICTRKSGRVLKSLLSALDPPKRFICLTEAIYIIKTYLHTENSPELRRVKGTNFTCE